MKPVLQKYKHGHPTPDCQSACVASLLEIELDKIPNLFHREWMDTLNDFLESQGKTFLLCMGNHYHPKDIYYIVVLGFIEDNIMKAHHALICKNKTIEHDPYGEEGLPKGMKLQDFLDSYPNVKIYNTQIIIDKETSV